MNLKVITITATIAGVALVLQCNAPELTSPSPDPPVRIHAPVPPLPSGIDADRFHNKFFLVVNVVDGDTFDIALSMSDPNRTRIRLLGVDTPETKHPRMTVQHFGPEATRFVEQVTLYRMIRVHLDPASDIRGKYGRLLAIIELDDSSILNERLLTLGLGYAETRFPNSLKERYLLLQATAMATRTGLWKTVTFEQLPPWLQTANPTILAPLEPR